MFLQNETNEIDTSNITFDIILSFNEQIYDFVKFFLDIPLFDQKVKPQIYYYKNDKHMCISKNELFENFINKSDLEIHINAMCLNTDHLEENIKPKIYCFSEDYKSNKNPTTSPIMYNDYDSDITVQLNILTKGSHKLSYKNKKMEDLKGFIYNSKIFLEENKDLPCFSIKFSKNFFYEYSFFIIQALVDRFPTIGICGGLHCSQSMLHINTLSNSVCFYEKINIVLANTVSDFFKKYLSYNIIHSYRTYYSNSCQYEQIKDFRLVNKSNLFTVSRDEKLKDYEYNLHLIEYLEFINESLKSNMYYLDIIYNTAIHIILPPPEFFMHSKTAYERLQNALKNVPIQYKNEFGFTGYLAFTVLENKIVCDIRIKWFMKDYFNTLMELVDLGEIDFIKH